MLSTIQLIQEPFNFMSK